jgi:hypothetical protein
LSKRGANLRVALATVALLIAALLLFRYAVYERPAPPAPVPVAQAPVTPAAARNEAVVLSVSGNVQKSQGGAWAQLSAGEKLSTNAELRTGKGASTEVRVGESDKVTLSESSQLIIKDLTQEVRRLRLTRGRLTVDEQDPQAAPLRVEDGNGAVAEGRKARFSVLSTGTAIAVATEKGEVTLTSNMHTVAVTAGSESIAVRGQAPVAAKPVSRKVLLAVANAIIGANAEMCAELDGAVPTGTELTVDEIVTLPDAQGRFHLKVPRARGKKSVLVALRDATGRTKTREVPCAPSPAEVRDVAIKWRDAQ